MQEQKALCELFLSSERHLPLPLPQPLSVQLKENHEEDRGKRDGSLNPKSLRKTDSRHPVDLNIRCHEPSPVPTRSDPCADFAGSLGVAVEEVRIDCCSDDHDAHTLRRCEHCNHHIMPVLFKGETENYQTHAEDKGSWICDDQTGLRIQTARMSVHVVSAHGIVEEVASEPANQDTDDAEEVEVSQSLRREAVTVCQPDPDRCVHANNPGEIEEVVNQNSQNRELGNGDNRPS